jgi:hypothetical protein
LLVLPALLGAMEVGPGDKIADVYATYGKPRGKADMGDRQLLYYERGEVELRSGVVTRVAFLSEEDYAAREAREAAAEERAQSLIAEGESVKQERLADPSFQKLSPASQLAYWQDFARRYPGVSCGDQITVARALVREQAEHDRKLAEQEQLIAEAEARRLNQERYDFYPVGYGYGYGAYGYGYGRSYGRGRGGHYYPDVDRPRYRDASGPFVPTGIVPAFSGDPIVAPFRPAPAPQTYYPWANLPPAGSVGNRMPDYRPTPRGRY